MPCQLGWIYASQQMEYDRIKMVTMMSSYCSSCNQMNEKTILESGVENWNILKGFCGSIHQNGVQFNVFRENKQ
jgi:hypothetical protein